MKNIAEAIDTPKLRPDPQLRHEQPASTSSKPGFFLRVSRILIRRFLDE